MEVISEQFHRSATRARKLFEGLDDATLARCDGARWSIADCVEHLNITARRFMPLLGEARAAAPPLSPDRELKEDLIGRLLRWFLEPPYRTRVKTPTPFEPVEGKAPGLILDEFLEFQLQLVEFTLSCEGLAIDRVKLVSPFDARVRYSLYSALLIMAAHNRRHLWQAERVRVAISLRDPG